MQDRMKRFMEPCAVLVGCCLICTFGACEDTTSNPCGSRSRGTNFPAASGDSVSISEGISGDVWFWEGNFMANCPSGSVASVRREIRIHELTGIGQVDISPRGSSFYSEVHTPLVAIIESHANGFFEVELPPGRYSMFSLEDTLLYANGLDGSGHIYPVEVRKGKVAAIRFDINYLASF